MHHPFNLLLTTNTDGCLSYAPYSYVWTVSVHLSTQTHYHSHHVTGCEFSVFEVTLTDHHSINSVAPHSVLLPHSHLHRRKSYWYYCTGQKIYEAGESSLRVQAHSHSPKNKYTHTSKALEHSVSGHYHTKHATGFRFNWATPLYVVMLPASFSRWFLTLA